MVSKELSIPVLPKALFDVEHFTQEICQTSTPIPLLKKTITQANEWLNDQFRQHRGIRDLVLLRACFIDELLRGIWSTFNWGSDNDITLIAVGGYGRGELHPHSDIDLLILLQDDLYEKHKDNIESFITLLWDININVGHSVRSIKDCVQQATDDITIATNLMESRPITGNAALLGTLISETGPNKIWPSNTFFLAKKEEQTLRHHKFHNTEYNLEPNIKSCPGGLRDTQIIGWFAKRHFGVNRLSGLLEVGFLTEEEYNTIKEGTDFLWQVRYALHMIADRPEDRLLFEHQRQLAHLFGYKDNEKKLAIEQFMHTYYRWAMALSEINEMLFQLFDETIMRACDAEKTMEINPRFRINNNKIEVSNNKVFINHPSALLEIFVLMAQHENIKGVRASTIRLIRQSRYLIDDDFRRSSRNQKLFIELLRSPYRVTTQIKRMKRYGVLGRYIPAFGEIIGQMQYDLFHIYTVDAHSILVLMNMRRFAQDRKDTYPTAASIVGRLPKIELLYISGLFHDIAKGRGGDHSELGAVDAKDFCLLHGFNEKDSELVSWLVKHHLLMSSFSQKRDLNDPEVIKEFALIVRDQLHLDYLFALTVADINATNPTLWNSWKASLMRQLYTEAKRAIRNGIEQIDNREEWIEKTKEAAIAKLATKGFTTEEILSLWDNPGDDYFLRESANDIVWHTEAIAKRRDNKEQRDKPIILIKQIGKSINEGATQIFISALNQKGLFAVVASTMGHLNLNIVAARISTSDNGRALDTFLVLDSDGKPLNKKSNRIKDVQQQLEINLQDRERYFDIVSKRTPRALRHFKYPTETSTEYNPQTQQTLLEVISPDRPGLLALIGKIFLDHNISLQKASISTLGERVEDIFFISSQDGNPISDPVALQQLEMSIRNELDAQINLDTKITRTLNI